MAKLSILRNCRHFVLTMVLSCLMYQIYPKGNGLAKSINKNPMTIIKKIVGENKKYWNSKLKHVLWIDRITNMEAIGKSPFELAYGMSVTLSIHVKILVYHLLQHFISK